VNFNGEEWKVYLPEKIQWGAFFIFMAAVVDFFDGFVARLMKADSAMGKQLDSLADVVSFGVAPGMIMYQMLRLAFAYEPDGLETPFYNLLPALLLPASTAWRLARFNIDPSQAYGFKGVPAPAAGLFIAAIPLITLYNQFGVQELLLNKWVLYAIIGIVSYLMVSTLPLMGLKFRNYSVKDNWHRFLLLAVALISALLFQWMAVPIVFVLYILLSLLTQNKTA
jgi:CDP-diacylglycerol--serine O-phosphatidyltransferase